MSFLFFNERHPKNKKGQHLIPFLQPIEINKFLTKHDTLIKRLKLAYSDTGSWDSKILPCIRQLALLCGHLPYSANGVFSGQDGLFKGSIQAATYAVEIMESTVQLEKNIMAQHLLQGRLKAAALLAGLCSLLDTFEKISIAENSITQENAFFHINENNHVNHLAFNPLATPYDTWVREKLDKNTSIELALHWKSTPPVTQSRQNLRLFYARHILVSETMAWLGDAGPLPLIELMKCLTADSDFEEFSSSVIKARDLGVFRACQFEREQMGAKLGKVLAPHGWQNTLIRILRARILNDWAINAKDSPLRKGADGLFLYWPDICPILIDDLTNFGLTDLPTDPDIWAGCLLESGLTIPSKKGLATCWITVTPNAKPREAIKLSDAHFFTGNKNLYAKTIKRNFETELNEEQSCALSQLTREILESTDKVFTQHIPSEQMVTQQNTITWHINEKYESSNPALSAIFDLLNTEPQKVSELLIDEGLFLSDHLNFLNADLTFERLVTSLLSNNLIYENDRGEPLWVTHTDIHGSLQRGVILKADCLGARLEGNDLSFKEIFTALHHRKPSPHFAFIRHEAQSSDQLSFNFCEEENS